MQTPGQNVPGTPWQKYQAMKLQMIEKGRWSQEKDNELRSFLGLPEFGSPEAPESTPAEQKGYNDMSSKQLKAIAKKRGMKTSGSREKIIERLNETDQPAPIVEENPVEEPAGEEESHEVSNDEENNVSADQTPEEAPAPESTPAETSQEETTEPVVEEKKSKKKSKK